jgi:hypothetical protein
MPSNAKQQKQIFHKITGQCSSEESLSYERQENVEELLDQKTLNKNSKGWRPAQGPEFKFHYHSYLLPPNK